jgi:hypothetical protein
MKPASRRAMLLAALGLAAGPALAHDSWLSPARTPAKALVELSTGNRYPVQEFNPAAASLALSQCTDGAAPAKTLKAMRDRPQWLELGVARGSKPLACWVELKPHALTMEPEKVKVYFDEIRPPAAVREAWTAMQARRVAWQESYRKFARIELPQPGASPQRLAAARRPVGMDMEMVVRGDQPIAVGRPLEFQVLRDGRPLAGFAVELVSERSPLGIWRETDSEGVVRHTLPFAGRWLLRGTDLRPAPQREDSWESRFATLTFEANVP